MTAEPDRDLPASAFGPPKRDGRTMAAWSAERPRQTIDLTPIGESKFKKIKAYLPHAAVLGVALMVGAGAATLATAPAMTDGVDEVSGLSAISARNMGLALNIDPTGQQRRQAAIGRDVSALKSEIGRLQRALDQSKTTQAALSKATAGQEDVRNLKGEIASLQKTLEATRDSAAAKIEALTAKIEEPDDDAVRVAELQARLEKIEKAAAPTAAPPPLPVARATSDPETTGSVSPPDAGPQIVRNWVVRDVYDGVALLDGRKGLMEVVRGETVPGLGRIKGIERRDRQWVVLTERGVILQRP